MPDWRQSLREAITNARELLSLLGLDALADRLPPDDAGFALRVPRGFVARMRHGDPRDPLLLQVLPQLAENVEVPGFGHDAVGDLTARAAHGVLHKYQGRALLIAGGSCAVNCRYCFRRHFPYAEEIAAAAGWREALAHIRGDRSLREVILSGGDPLALSTAKLDELGAALAKIPHVKTPAYPHPRAGGAAGAHRCRVLPLAGRAAVAARGRAACQPCARTGRFGARRLLALARGRRDLLNQSVLLAGINDDVDSLAALSERLSDCGVLPYYLHQLDRVHGAAHFAVADERARALVQDLRSRLPGYLVPRLVRETAGESSKTPL